MKNQFPSATTSSPTPGRIYSLIVIGFAVFMACLTFDALRSSSATDGEKKEPSATAAPGPMASDVASVPSAAKQAADSTTTLPVAQASTDEILPLNRQRFSQWLVIAGLAALATFFLPGPRVRSEGKRPSILDADAIAEATGLPVLGELFPKQTRAAAAPAIARKPSFNVRRAVVLVGELSLCVGFIVAIAGSASHSRIAKQFTNDPLNAYAASVRLVASHVTSLVQ